jgi:hypothetical protein
MDCAMTCETCGHALAIGEHPFCPHGFPAANRRVADVTWPGGKTFENGFDRPMTFFSPKDYHAALAARGLKVRGDGEEHFSWLSKESLANAKELVSRHVDRA